MNKIMFLFFTALTSFLLLVSCSSSNYGGIAGTTIEVDPTLKNDILFSDLFDSVCHVKLETTNDILIKEISTVKCAKNSVYILDRPMLTLYSFDATSGKCLFKIQNIGQGPKEYTKISDFCIDEKQDRLYLFCEMEKIQEYDLSGKYINEYLVRQTGQTIACNGDYLYIYAGNNPNTINGQKENYYLLIFNKIDGSLKGELPFEDNPTLWVTRTYNSSEAFYSYDDAIHFFLPYSQNIYSIRKDKVSVAYQFDFGKYNLPKNLSEYLLEELDQVPYAYGLNSCWENDSYLSITMRINQGYQAQILYSKKHDFVEVGNFWDDIAFVRPKIAFVTNDWMLGYGSASDCVVLSAHNLPNNENRWIKEISAELTEDDNPVLFFYYFKK